MENTERLRLRCDRCGERVPTTSGFVNRHRDWRCYCPPCKSIEEVHRDAQVELTASIDARRTVEPVRYELAGQQAAMRLGGGA